MQALESLRPRLELIIYPGIYMIWRSRSLEKD